MKHWGDYVSVVVYDFCSLYIFSVFTCVFLSCLLIVMHFSLSTVTDNSSDSLQVHVMS